MLSLNLKALEFEFQIVDYLSLLPRCHDETKKYQDFLWIRTHIVSGREKPRYKLLEMVSDLNTVQHPTH